MYYSKTGQAFLEEKNFEKVQNSIPGHNTIPGYTGFIPSQENEQDALQLQGNRNHIPGYQGFVPGIKSENLFGKTFGRTTLLSSTQGHHRGADLPPELRYTSTIQDNYIDQREQKLRDIQLYGKLDPETSQALAYTLSNLTQSQQKSTSPCRQDKERVSELTYEQMLEQLKKEQQ